MDRPVVTAWSADPLTAEGVATMLGADPDLDVVSIDRMAWADVVLIVGPVLDPRAAELISQVNPRSQARIVLVIDELTDADLRLAMAHPVLAVLARAEVTRETLIDTIRAVHADRALPRLIDQVERVGSDRLRPRGASGILLAAREQEVLRLLAQGCDTTEIAKRMAYSERTVKNIIRVILERLGSRNRAHAVAFATREGII
jgi:DNA-binding NarL/FixJ family response regulator